METKCDLYSVQGGLGDCPITSSIKVNVAIPNKFLRENTSIIPALRKNILCFMKFAFERDLKPQVRFAPWEKKIRARIYLRQMAWGFLRESCI